MDGRNEDTAILSLLSLSASAPASSILTEIPSLPTNNTASTAIPISTKPLHRRAKSRSRRLSDARDAVAMSMSISPPVSAQAVSISSSGKKSKGTATAIDHVCETCSKVYRHPSCLIKHRWEHTPHWRESSKYVLSKHQQVQLLEAAAILSHLSPKTEGLPEDRSLWPSFLSGGSVPAPSHDHRGPRMHDFTITGNITRNSASPGIVGVSYSSSSEDSSSFNPATPPAPIGYGRYANVRVKQEDESEDEDIEHNGMDTYEIKGRRDERDVIMDNDWDGEMEMEMD